MDCLTFYGSVKENIFAVGITRCGFSQNHQTNMLQNDTDTSRENLKRQEAIRYDQNNDTG